MSTSRKLFLLSLCSAVAALAVTQQGWHDGILLSLVVTSLVVLLALTPRAEKLPTSGRSSDQQRE